MADSVGAGFPNTGINKGHLFYDLDEEALWEYISGNPRLVSSWKLLSGRFDTQPDTSLWGENQAGAQWFYEVDNAWYGWDGAETILISSTGSVNTVELVDDFLGTTVSTSDIPILGWSFGTNGSGSLVESIFPQIASHPGLWDIRSGGGVGDFGELLLGSNGVGCFEISDKFAITFIAKVGSIVDANTQFRVGCDTIPVGTSHASGVFIDKRDTDTNWQFVCSSSAPNTTRVDSGVLVTADTFYRFDIRRINGGSIGFRLNLGQETVITTNIPSIGVCPFIFVRTLNGVSKSIFIDYFRIRFSSLNR